MKKLLIRKRTFLMKKSIPPKNNQNINVEEVDEDIVFEESNDGNFSDKRFIASGTSISQSGPDISVSSKELEKKCQYVEPVEKEKK